MVDIKGYGVIFLLSTAFSQRSVRCRSSYRGTLGNCFKRFYAMAQNKLHYAIHYHTAVKVIVERADHRKEHMGLAAWKNASMGKIVKADVSVAKNYLIREERQDSC